MFVLTGHTLCGCCEVRGFDGFREAFVEGIKAQGVTTGGSTPPVKKTK
jgi:hypothetical protein